MPAATFFASAERACEHTLAEQRQTVVTAPFITKVLNASSCMMLILNEHRQIIAANDAFQSFFGLSVPATLLSLRPGEAVSCVHREDGPGGCGTSETCSACGVASTILASQKNGIQSDGECRVMMSSNGCTALDLEVKATPIDVSGATFTIFSLEDVGSDKRRKVLERTFFHDVLNTIGGINGIATLLRDNDGSHSETDVEYKQLMVDLSDHLVEEISQQRRLLEAERGEYVPETRCTNLKELLEEVCKLYGNHIRTPHRTIIIENISPCQLSTDPAILRRVIGNMVLNALEATPPGGTVSVSLTVNDTHIVISVTNLGEIPRDVQLRIFKRSFSTKDSSGRGIGTYSMKLFGVRYLGGTVGFNSQNGLTTFFIKLPVAQGDDMIGTRWQQDLDRL
jgi:K+-sensing histidine kinase KdpD